MLRAAVPHLKDYGFFDIVSARMNRRARDKKSGDLHHRRFERFGVYDEKWICFLPGGVAFEQAKRLGLIPKNSDFVVYEMPLGLLSPDPAVARGIFDGIVADFESRYSHLKDLCIAGYSIGQYPGVFVANNFPVKKLVLVGPGNAFGSCLWECVATQNVRRLAQARGIRCAEEYDRVLEGTNPFENIDGLPCDIEVHLGTHDRYTPTRLGLDFLLALERKGKRPRVRLYDGKGHILTLAEFGMNNPY